VNIKHMLITAATVVGIVAVANRISFTRNLIGNSSVQPWF